MSPDRHVTALALTPDGSAVIAADPVGHLKMWSLPGRELLWSRDDVPTASLAISPDGRYLATVGNTYDDSGDPFDGPATSTFTVWDLNTHTAHLTVDLNDWQYGATPTSVVFSPDGSRIAIAYWNGFVGIYDLALRDRTWLETPETDRSIVFTPDSQRLLAASPTYLKQADATTGKALSLSLLPGPRDVTRMTYTEDGRWLVISHPRSLTVLDAPTLKDARTLQVVVADLTLPTEAPTDTFAEAFAVAAGQDHQLLVGTGSVLVSIQMDLEQWKSAACEIAARKLTHDEWNHFLPGIPYSPACR